MPLQGKQSPDLLELFPPEFKELTALSKKAAYSPTLASGEVKGQMQRPLGIPESPGNSPKIPSFHIKEWPVITLVWTRAGKAPIQT